MIEIERQPREHDNLFRLVQGLFDYDEAFLKWWYTHRGVQAGVLSGITSNWEVRLTPLTLGGASPHTGELQGVVFFGSAAVSNLAEPAVTQSFLKRDFLL